MILQISTIERSNIVYSADTTIFKSPD